MPRKPKPQLPILLTLPAGLIDLFECATSATAREPSRSTPATARCASTCRATVMLGLILSRLSHAYRLLVLTHKRLAT